jgi:hypothetical protein
LLGPLFLLFNAHFSGPELLWPLWPVIAMECADAMDAVALSPLFRIFGAVAAHGILDVHLFGILVNAAITVVVFGRTAYTSMGWFVWINTRLNAGDDRSRGCSPCST